MPGVAGGQNRLWDIQSPLASRLLGVLGCEGARVPESGLLSRSTPWLINHPFSCADLICFCLQHHRLQLALRCEDQQELTPSPLLFPGSVPRFILKNSFSSCRKHPSKGLGLGSRACLRRPHRPAVARAEGRGVWELGSSQTCQGKTCSRAACLASLHHPSLGFAARAKKKITANILKHASTAKPQTSLLPASPLCLGLLLNRLPLLLS